LFIQNKYEKNNPSHRYYTTGAGNCQIPKDKIIQLSMRQHQLPPQPHITEQAKQTTRRFRQSLSLTRSEELDSCGNRTGLALYIIYYITCLCKSQTEIIKKSRIFFEASNSLFTNA